MRCTTWVVNTVATCEQQRFELSSPFLKGEGWVKGHAKHKILTLTWAA
jgi:hypothetical protein